MVDELDVVPDLGLHESVDLVEDKVVGILDVLAEVVVGLEEFASSAGSADEDVRDVGELVDLLADFDPADEEGDSAIGERRVT